MDETHEITRLLGLACDGDRAARETLFERCYKELHVIARRQVARERQDHSLQATALLHEVYLKLFGSTSVDWQNRAQFYAIAATQMRRILVDYARSRKADKRGGEAIRFSLDDADGAADFDPDQMLNVNRALDQLQEYDPHLARVVECKYFAGMKDEEIAEATGVSYAQVRRDWTFAKSWLKPRLGEQT